MYDLEDKVIARGIGLCTIRGKTYGKVSYMVVDRLGRWYDGLLESDLRFPSEPVTAVSCGGSVQFIHHGLELVK